MNTTSNDVSWFAELAKQIDEQAVVSMMLVNKARQLSHLYTPSSAADPDEYAAALLPLVLNTLTTLVANQVDIDAVKERYRDDELTRQTKATIEQAAADYQREQERSAQSREQQRKSWVR